MFLKFIFQILYIMRSEVLKLMSISWCVYKNCEIGRSHIWKTFKEAAQRALLDERATQEAAKAFAAEMSLGFFSSAMGTTWETIWENKLWKTKNIKQLP